MSEAKTGFTRGFFGCFGVLAAVVLVVVAFLSLSQYTPSKAPTTSTDRRADAVVACGLALIDAENSGQVSQGAQLQIPWRVYETGEGKDGARQVSCAAVDDVGELGVIVDIACTDVNDSSCWRLVKIARP